MGVSLLPGVSLYGLASGVGIMSYAIFRKGRSSASSRGPMLDRSLVLNVGINECSCWDRLCPVCLFLWIRAVIHGIGPVYFRPRGAVYGLDRVSFCFRSYRPDVLSMRKGRGVPVFVKTPVCFYRSWECRVDRGPRMIHFES